ncbi:hypothetical protein POKO110462_01555 [Pontibacter korlensis]|uniref:Vitellogenin II n=1 Tax=Pontibacter korlensis TaxID=400092 RepID=A0A0E3ZFJ9_9BACT|nr:hypothetical protein [Pontibacter korlensis]AKD02923.1 hypothetical protein PKOR_07030 [Pontibacter korlensis]
MKRYKLLTLAPVLALMAVGCSSPVAMQSSEYDDMYYSSSDQTVYVEPAAQVQPSTQARQQQQQQYENSNNSNQEALAEGEVLNPEYSESYITQNYSGDEYYDGRAYDERDNWYRPDYSFVDPYWGSSYAPRRMSYAFYDPFYDPFFHDPFYYDPFWSSARFRTGVSISFSYGWGRGFYGLPHYGYSNWWPNSYGYGFYNGYNRGFYNGYYTHNPYTWYNDRPVVIGKASRVQYGPRDSRNTQLNGNTTGRPARVERGENLEQQQQSQGVVGRQTRSSRSTVAPSTGSAKPELPSRPSRRSGNSTRVEQQSAQPAVTPGSRNTRTREYTPSRSTEPQQRREIRTRTIERSSQPSRSIERSRSVESRPSRSTFESRPSSSPSPSINRSSNSSSNSSSSGSSSGGGRPTRGNN